MVARPGRVSVLLLLLLLLLLLTAGRFTVQIRGKHI